MVFGITGNIYKEDVKTAAVDLISFLNEKSIKYFIDNDFQTLLSTDLKSINFCKEVDLINNSNVIISLGGDGTFLNTARKVGNKNLPILGVNLGNLGFLSGITQQETNKVIADILKDRYVIQNLVVLKADFKGKFLYGLNDIVIDKSDSIRMIEIEMFYNKEKIVKCIADGIIISTPTGSTGYSLSAGGPIVNPESKVFILTPICPHTLNLRPILVPDDSEIKIRINKKSMVRITADGQELQSDNSPIDILISKADYTVKAIKKINTTYFDTLKKKLLWGEDKRKF